MEEECLSSQIKRQNRTETSHVEGSDADINDQIDMIR